MKNFKLFKVVILFFLWHSAVAQEVPKIRINPAQAYGGSVSEYFDNIEYIPLETNKESLFGDIANLVITDSSIVVADLDTRSVLFFTLSGKYIAKAKTKKITALPNISYDITNNSIVISEYDYKSSTIEERYFNCTGNELPKKIKIAPTNSPKLKLVDDYSVEFNSCFFSKSEIPKDSTYYLINIYKGGNIYKHLLPYNQKKSIAFCKLGGTIRPIKSNQIKEDGEFYITTPYDYNLYKINKDTATKLYQFVFPASRVVSSSVLNSTDLIYLDSVRNSNRNFITDVVNIYFHKNLLLFKINTRSYFFNPSSSNESQYNFMYHMATNKIISLERITPDKNSYFLPILGNGITAAFNGLIFKNDSYYSSLSSLQMFTAREATKNKNPQYPAVVQNYFTSQTRKSNPVIVRMKLKE